MNELLQVLSKLLNNAEVDLNELHVKMTEDEDGNITLKYISPKSNPIVKTIKKELQEMDDDVFTAAAELLMKTDRKAYEVMANLENTRNIPELQQAYKIFLGCVNTIVEGRVKELTAEVNRLFNKYLDKHEEK